MPTVTVEIVIHDERDGCMYSRVYVDTPDWSESVRNLISLTMGDGVYPDFVTATIGNGVASGFLGYFDGGNGERIGTWLVTNTILTPEGN